MALFNKFDLSTDFTQFFFIGLIIIMTLVVLMTWVAPKAKDRRRDKGGKGGKPDDRYASFQGELID